MTTIAEALGIDWGNDVKQAPQYRLTHHARQQAALKGWTSDDVLLAANQPLHTSRSVRYPGQFRHVRAGIVAVVDTATNLVVTVYVDRVETDLREDQSDTDAHRYGVQHKRNVSKQKKKR
jgi:hypothetical protein